MPKSVVPATDMYPSLNELLAAYGDDAIKNRIMPNSLIASLSHRYNEHGLEYATSQLHPDGRVTNKCMYDDSILGAQEELNDAIFNLLVVCLKQELGQQQKGIYSWMPRQALNYAIQAWESLSPLGASGTSL